MKRGLVMTLISNEELLSMNIDTLIDTLIYNITGLSTTADMQNKLRASLSLKSKAELLEKALTLAPLYKEDRISYTKEEYEKLEKQRAATIPKKTKLDTHYSTVEEPFTKRFTAIDKAHTELYVRTKGVKWVEALNKDTIVCCADNTCDRQAAEARCEGVKIVWVKWEVDNEYN